MRWLRKFWRDRESVKRERLLRELVAQLDHPEAPQRLTAIVHLGYISDLRTLEPILKAHQRETDPYCRLHLAVSLANMQQREALAHFFDDVKSVDAEGWNDWDEAPELMSALTKLGDIAFPSLIAALSDNNQTVRWIAIESLSELKDPRAVEPLRSLLHDPNVSEMAAEAIAMIESRQR